MDLIGTVLLDRYQIDKKIGEGGMGHVYHARDNVTGQDVAIKILKADLSLKDTYVRRFEREIRSGSLLNHEGIVRIIDEGEIDSKPFLVMEYVEGRNLRKWARNKRRIIPLILEKFEKICEAIHCAHRHGIIHRDLKPENVLVTYTGEVKLMDFGLARKVQETSMITSPGTFIGTVVYTSPEQASGKLIDPRSDLYSIGVMLFEMVTGKLPFKSEDPIAVLFQHIHNKPPLASDYNKDIPPELDNFINMVLSKEPEKRPENALVMAGMLRELQGLPPKKYEEPKASNKFQDFFGKDHTTEIIEDVRRLDSVQVSEITTGEVEVTFLLLELSDFISKTHQLDYPSVQKFIDEFNHRLETHMLKRRGLLIQPNSYKAFYVFRSTDNKNQAKAAVDAAVKIQRSLKELCESGIPKLFSRIPLNIGIETSIIPAELAMRENLSKIVSNAKVYHTATLIQNLSKALPGSSILVCGSTYDKVKDEIPGLLFKKIFVRGRMEPVFVYQINWMEK